MNMRTTLIVVAAIAAALSIWAIATHGRKPMAIEVGRQYRLISFGSVATAIVPEDASVDVQSYVLTVVYDDVITKDDGVAQCGVVRVPKLHLQVDSSLPLNTVVWDQPTVVDGLSYQRARWHPEVVRPDKGTPIRIRQKILFRE